MAVKREHQINEDIRDPEVRLVGAEGEQLGIMSAAKAKRKTGCSEGKDAGRFSR